jgi:hypothetical protein
MYTKSLVPHAPPGLTPAEIIEYYSMPEPNSGCLLWLGPIDSKGYGRLKGEPAHRLSLETATGKRVPRGRGLHTLHSCDLPCCVNDAHLSTGTMADNIRDAAKKGRLARGEKHYSAKLTTEQVHEIRTNGMGRNEAARHFGVSDRMITKIRKGDSWAWLQGDGCSLDRDAVREAMDGYRTAIGMAGRAVRNGMRVGEAVREFGFSARGIQRASLGQ